MCFKKNSKLRKIGQVCSSSRIPPVPCQVPQLSWKSLIAVGWGPWLHFPLLLHDSVFCCMLQKRKVIQKAVYTFYTFHTFYTLYTLFTLYNFYTFSLFVLLLFYIFRTLCKFNSFYTFYLRPLHMQRCPKGAFYFWSCRVSRRFLVNHSCGPLLFRADRQCGN